MKSAPSGKPIRVLIADDHSVAREGLAAMLGRRKQFQIIGEARDGDEAIELCRRLKPDVLLLDLRMPRKDGFAVMEALKAQNLSTRILIMTTYEGDEDVRRALAAGAKGYLLKDSAREHVWDAVTAVDEGQTALTPTLAAKVATSLGKPELSGREREVLALLAQGKSNKEIGSALFVSEATAKAHVTAILDKLGAPGRTAAVVIAAQRGLVHLG